MAEAYTKLSHAPPEVADPEAPERVQIFVSRHRYFFLLLAVLVAQLLLLSIQITRSQGTLLIQVWAVSALEPFQRAAHWMVSGVAGSWDNLQDLRNARERNRELQRKMAVLRASLDRLSAQAGELDDLRSQLDYKTRAPFESLAAEVIASSPGASTRAVFLSRGAGNGMKPDLAVVTPEGVVGKVLHAYPRTSQVLMIIDSQSGAGCMIERSRLQGVLKGTGHKLCRMEYVLNEQNVQVGDRVLTSGQDRVYPKGLLLGTVVEVKDGHIYKEILVEPAAHLDRLESVLVVLPPKTGLLESRHESSPQQ